jgi:hypothetical protein
LWLSSAWFGKIRVVRAASLFISCVLILVKGGLGVSEAAKTTQIVSNIEGLSVFVQPTDGTYEIQTGNGAHSVIHARVAAEIDHKWIRSTDYPTHEISQSNVDDAFGHGRKLTITSFGLPNAPDLAYTLLIYEGKGFGKITPAIR